MHIKVTLQITGTVHVAIVQATFFKHLKILMHICIYNTPTFKTEVLCYVTYICITLK